MFKFIHVYPKDDKYILEYKEQDAPNGIRLDVLTSPTRKELLALTKEEAIKEAADFLKVCEGFVDYLENEPSRRRGFTLGG